MGRSFGDFAGPSTVVPAKKTASGFEDLRWVSGLDFCDPRDLSAQTDNRRLRYRGQPLQARVAV